MIRYITFVLNDGRVETATCFGRRDLCKSIDRVLAYVAVGRIVAFMVHDGSDTGAALMQRTGSINDGFRELHV